MHTHIYTEWEREREDLLEFLENFLKQSTFQTDNNLAGKLKSVISLKTKFNLFKLFIGFLLLKVVIHSQTKWRKTQRLRI